MKFVVALCPGASDLSSVETRGRHGLLLIQYTYLYDRSTMPGDHARAIMPIDLSPFSNSLLEISFLKSFFSIFHY